ncbi:hypothetical protein [Streptomyces sp. NPDC090022]|uniref:hypothetical protein n=1 Tax=Streptomyces sp. NPDC090022 TaxID=3365920 RepID=UPI0037FA7E95
MSEIPREHLEHMARIEAKLDTLLAQTADLQQHAGTNAMTEKRLGSLEKWRYAVGGSVFISLASIATSLANVAPR